MFKLIRKLIKLILIAAILVGAFIGLTGYFKYKEAIKAIPIEEKVASIQESSNYTPLDEISADFTDAIVAIEDHRFYEHGAVDPIALARATFINLREKEVLQGGSTLTQQVAKNIYFENDQNFVRKVAELFVAYNLEKIYSKDEILELYVNVIYYGDGNYGIKEASENYFGKMPLELNYDEATLLAGLPQAPSAYALSTNYERAKQRQSEVIEALTEYRN
ncbi:transglycosylase domain-containing protein [Bacillus sp. AGMB 02131]|uniref:Transglycosylase domain-containing protein n=1 Tax=Peribacillus faecalis TaxID=2772559 RepID=A0A927CXY8_9BACI|nr:biosynthetic peptidoglycan transglycosylase [Peribacillus faecalis]MBD3107980.1 transglycosylase domain-containing protein [Peribacillus faecalis]